MNYTTHALFIRGTTLIELLLYLAISTGILIGVAATSMSVLEQREKARAIDAVQYAETIAMGLVAEDIRSASGVLAPFSPNATSSVLQLRYGDPQKDPTIIEAASGTLYRTVASGERAAILPYSVNLSDGMFTRIEGANPYPSIVITGHLYTGSSTIGNTYKASLDIFRTFTLRAPTP